MVDARANPLTGNILIRYHRRKILPKQVLSLLKTALKKAKNPAERRLKRAVRNKTIAPWHVMSPHEVLLAVKSITPTGLSTVEARARLRASGANLLPEILGRSDWEVFANQFNNLPSLLLAGSAILSIVTGGIGDAVVIGLVVAVNAYVGYRNELSAERTIQSLSRTSHLPCIVYRDGKRVRIPAEEVVVGDLVVMQPGMQIPADIRLLHADQLSVDESVLTGEGLPVFKFPQSLERVNIPLADRINMLFRGTTVTGGNATGVVVATGQETEIGRIESLMEESTPPETPLQMKLRVLTGQLVMISLAAAGIVLILGIWRKRLWIDAIKSAISLAVAAIPEGLPTVATITLTGGVTRLERHRILVRQLEAIETLGSIDVLCLDKTGTLTQNRMEVCDLFTLSGPSNRSEAVTLLAKVIALCNDAHGESGSSTEAALLRFAHKQGLDPTPLRQDYPLLETWHRGERRRYMVTRHQSPKGGFFYAVKGSPMEVLSLCGRVMRAGRIHALTESDRAEILHSNERMARQALRVLGAAYLETASSTTSIKGKLIWLGNVGMADPLRPGAERLIKKIQDAGIRTVMLTGDQGATAHAIGKKLSLSAEKDIVLLDSTRLEEMHPDVLSSLSQRVHVFSRVSPAHKLKIVQALQKGGQVVAMTGDGINDGPALRVADVGIALGGSGTDVARKVADMVLLEDELESLIFAIEEGRTVHENIHKAVEYITSQNLSEILFTVVSHAIGLPEPLSPAQLLWVNLITDLLPEIALAREQPESDVLKRGPSPGRNIRIIEGEYGRISGEAAVITAAALGAYLYGIRKYGEGSQARTLAFLSLSSASLLHTLTARSARLSIFDHKRLKRNRLIPAAMGIGFGAELFAVLSPGLRRFLGGGRVMPADFVTAGIASFIPYLVNEGTKFIRMKTTIKGEKKYVLQRH